MLNTNYKRVILDPSYVAYSCSAYDISIIHLKKEKITFNARIYVYIYADIYMRYIYTYLVYLHISQTLRRFRYM